MTLDPLHLSPDQVDQALKTALVSCSPDLTNVTGCTLPRLRSPVLVDPLVQWDQRQELGRFGLELVGTPGPNCRILLDETTQDPKARIRLHVFGRANQTVVISASAWVQGYARLEADHQTLVIGDGGPGPAHFGSIILRGQRAAMVLGAGITSNGAGLLVHGEHTYLTVGDDCMFAHDVEISNSDSHGIFDIASLQVINPPKSVRIGRHVWLGSHVSVLKGVTIGDGSIIGTRSLVTQSIPSFALAVGSPAAVKKQGVSWSRHLQPNESGMRAVVEALAPP